MVTRLVVVMLNLFLITGLGFGQDLPSNFIFGSPTFFSSRGDFIPGDPMSLPGSLNLRSLQNIRLEDLPSTLRTLEGGFPQGTYLARFAQPLGSGNAQVVWVHFQLSNQPTPRQERSETGVDQSRVLGVRKEFVDQTRNRVVKIEEFSPLGILTQERFFFYTSTGQIQAIEQVMANGMRTSQSFSWNQDRLVEERFYQDPRLEIRTFNPLGQLTREERFVDQVLREEITFEFTDSRLARSMRRMFNGSGSETGRQEILLDSLGREILIRDYLGQELQRVQRIAYLEDTQLVTERTIETSPTQGQRSPNGQQSRPILAQPGNAQTMDLRIIRYQYNDDQELISEVTLVNQVPTQAKVFDGSRRIESFYQRGQVVLRITYDDELRVLEEDIQDGRVIGTRVIPQRSVPGVRP